MIKLLQNLSISSVTKIISYKYILSSRNNLCSLQASKINVKFTVKKSQIPKYRRIRRKLGQLPYVRYFVLQGVIDYHSQLKYILSTQYP